MEIMDGYIRVSRVAGRTGDRFQSPDEQRDRIAGWAAAHGVTIGEWHTDLDQSGGTMDRPGMALALERVKAGRSSGIVVAKLDRFARTVTGGLSTIRDLADHGARVVSVAEQIDPGTPMGRAMLGLLLIMAEWQRDQASEAIEAAQRRAVDARRFPGLTSYGYRRDETGLTEIDPVTGPVRRRIITERAAGRGWRSIAAGLTDDGIPTPNGDTRWAAQTLMGLVKSEAALGVWRGAHGLFDLEAWPPLVDRETWERANAVRGTRDEARHSRERMLAGIARCSSCRLVLARGVTRRKGKPDYVTYTCNTPRCDGRVTIGVQVLEALVLKAVQERVSQIRLEPSPVDDSGETGRLTTARDMAVRELEAWRDDLEIREALGDHDWREGLLARAHARDAAEAALATHRDRRGLEDLAALPTVTTPNLDDLDWPRQRLVVERMLHSVWVRRTTLRGPASTARLHERVLVVMRDDPNPPALPHRRAGGQPGPLTWPST